VRASVRHHEQHRDKLAEARATNATETATTLPASDSEPTAESLGLSESSSQTQGYTPNKAHGDRPTWYKAVRTGWTMLCDQRCVRMRTAAVACTHRGTPPRVCVRVGQRILAGSRPSSGELHRHLARRQFQSLAVAPPRAGAQATPEGRWSCATVAAGGFALLPSAAELHRGRGGRCSRSRLRSTPGDHPVRCASPGRRRRGVSFDGASASLKD
jgi:hypothetical protein